MRRRTAALLALVLAALVALMALRVRNSTITLFFSSADIQGQIDPKFPIRKSLILASVTLDHPRVLLKEGSDRVGLEVRVTAEAGGGKPIEGTIAADGRLRYAQGEGAFYLDDAKVVEIQADRIPPDMRPVAVEAATAVLGRYLAKTPIYRLKPDEWRQAIARHVLRSATVQSGRVVVVLGP